MKKAVLYARVSSDKQRIDRTIESQIDDLRHRITSSGDVLVKEYLDDGRSGASLYRPAMDELRTDLKTDLFDTVYFLAADRVARDVVYQNILVAEILKHKKQLIINGKDYFNSPENKFELTILGAVAELERAKIIERSVRGKFHRLRQGFLLGNGYNAFGHDYRPRSDSAPAAYVINEKEAEVVRNIFKWFVNDGASWSTIIRKLEKMAARTKMGRTVWNAFKVRTILKNTSYTGVKYFNTRSLVKEPNNPLRGIRYGKKVFKDRSEWIGVKIPAIIPQKLFDAAQARLEANRNRYRNPRETQLLSSLVRCGLCGVTCTPYQRYIRKYIQVDGKSVPTERLMHKVAYRCVRRIQQNLHDRDFDIKRCKSPEISARVLESHVLALVEKIILDPTELKKRLDYSKNKSHVNHAQMDEALEKAETELKKLAKEKRDVLDLYAKGKLDRRHYAGKCIWYDREIARVRADRDELLKKIPLLHKSGVVDASVRQFCSVARTRFEKAVDFENKRKFLLDHIESVIYYPDKITIVGSVPIQLPAYADPDQPSDASKIIFRIDGPLTRTFFGAARPKSS